MRADYQILTLNSAKEDTIRRRLVGMNREAEEEDEIACLCIVHTEQAGHELSLTPLYCLSMELISVVGQSSLPPCSQTYSTIRTQLTKETANTDTITNTYLLKCFARLL